MPFEGDIAEFAKFTSPPVETQVQSIIRRARALIADESRWTRNFQIGNSFCILGALRKAHHGDAWAPGTGGAQDVVMRVLRRRGYTGITSFNDRHASHAEVLAVLDAAYQAAGKPKRAQLDLSEISRKWVAPRREPLPAPPVCDPRPTVAEMIARIRAMQLPRARFPRSAQAEA
jgi:hypothetical protein